MVGNRSAFALAVQHRVLGAAFLALLAFFVWLTYAVFAKTFVDVVPVTLRASRIGLQMNPGGDVKVRGLVVGDVRDAHATAHGATLDLALDPDTVGLIPRNVTARILPKTLFGEKYVALQLPAKPSPQHLQAGDVIRESTVAIEVDTVLADVYPLLRTVRPAQLSYTLNALATALEGRGTELGRTLVTLDGYLTRLNPQVPGLVRDLRLSTHVARTYADVMPRLGRLLRNTVVTGNTVLVKQQQLRDLFTDVASMSSTTRDFLQANGRNIIELGRVSRPTLALLAEYSPEYPCLLKGLVNWVPQASDAWRGHTLHINLETISRQPPGYTPANEPVYGAANPPYCGALPDPPYDQQNLAPSPPDYRDGVPKSHTDNRPAPVFDLTSGFAGTRAEQHVVDAIAAPVMGVPPGRVPDVATLLFGPIARGTRVSLR